MYRWGCMVLCMLVVLTSCSSSVTPVTSGFRCEVSITYNGLSAQANLERSTQGTTVLSFTSPKELNGFTLTYDGEQVAMSYRGVTLPLGDQAIPTSAVRLIDDALECCSATVGKAEISGECDGGRFTLLFDPESGYPTELHILSLDLKVMFSGWQRF